MLLSLICPHLSTIEYSISKWLKNKMQTTAQSIIFKCAVKQRTSKYLPIVRSWTGWKRLSVNCSSKQDLPTARRKTLQQSNFLYIYISLNAQTNTGIIITIIRPHRSTTYVDVAYYYQQSCVVCRSHYWALQKWLHRSRCHLGWGLGWAQRTMY